MRKSLKKIKSERKLKSNRRKLSIRKKISGTSEIPRICVAKTNKHINVQVIDDVAGKTVACVTTFGKSKVGSSANVESAAKVGSAVADKLKALKVERAVFDRNGGKYTGVIAKVADSIREAGIQI